jgi:hypothetical protein
VRDIAALADRLRGLIDSPEHRAAMGARALGQVSRLDFAADRDGLINALESIASKKARAAA